MSIKIDKAKIEDDIRYAMYKQRCTLKEAAKRIGLSYTHLIAWMGEGEGKRKGEMRISTLNKVSDFTGTPVNEYFIETENN